MQNNGTSEVSLAQNLSLMVKGAGFARGGRGWGGIGGGAAAKFAGFWPQLACLNTIEFYVMMFEIIVAHFPTKK